MSQEMAPELVITEDDPLENEDNIRLMMQSNSMVRIEEVDSPLF